MRVELFFAEWHILWTPSKSKIQKYRIQKLNFSVGFWILDKVPSKVAAKAAAAPTEPAASASGEAA